jgi:CRISPR/Cas system CSM-associated protein Csm3 (group 7 of RAMP superfamily)
LLEVEKAMAEKGEKVDGFHRLSTLWKIDYEVEALEPLLTGAAYEEAKEDVSDLLGKELPKTEPDAVPLFIEDRAVITGNAVKGVFRHIISAQLTEAGQKVCVQEIKLRKGVNAQKLGRIESCEPDNPCQVCKWFGTGGRRSSRKQDSDEQDSGRSSSGRQGALYFSMLVSRESIKDVLMKEPIPMVALSEDTNAMIAGRGEGRFAVLVAVKKGTIFSGWITGDNLDEAAIGAIKEIQDISEKGFLKFGGFKTRGFGSVKMRVKSVEKYRAAPFSLEKKYEGEELADFLKICQEAYHRLLTKV